MGEAKRVCTFQLLCFIFSENPFFCSECTVFMFFLSQSEVLRYLKVHCHERALYFNSSLILRIFFFQDFFLCRVLVDKTPPFD